MKKWQIWTVAAVVVAAVGLGCLFGGKAWGESESSSDGDRFAANGAPGMGRPDGSMPSGGFAGRNGGGAVIGSIIAVDSTSITVKTSDGSTKIVFFGSSATISLVTQGSASDLTTGANVVVTGTANTDGTLTATSIRLGDSVSVGNSGPLVGGATPSDSAPADESETSTTQSTTN